MADKHLTEAAWKTFAKGRDLKDAALLKAFAGFAKAEKAPASEQLAALAQLDTQVGALRKAHKADKALTAHLDDIDKALAAERKRTEQARQAEQEAGDDEADSPALLTSKLIPLLRQVRKGETMQALIALAGKDAAVLLSRKSISPTRRKLMSEYLGAAGGVKYVAGQCLFEEKACTFVVQSKAAGLAKHLRAALLRQTELRMKVRVRGQDPNDIDSDGEDPVDGEDDVSGAAATAGPQAGAGTAAGAGTSTAAKAGTDGSDRAAASGGNDGSDRAAASGGNDGSDRAAASGGNDGAAASGGNDFAASLGAWQQARNDAVAVLKQLAREAAELRVEDSRNAVIEVQAVVKQLQSDPRDVRQVNELLRYVNEDDVVFDVCDLDRDIRTPMLDALRSMQRALT